MRFSITCILTLLAAGIQANIADIWLPETVKEGTDFDILIDITSGQGVRDQYLIFNYLSNSKDIPDNRKDIDLAYVPLDPFDPTLKRKLGSFILLNMSLILI